MTNSNYCLHWYLRFCGTLPWGIWWVGNNTSVYRSRFSSSVTCLTAWQPVALDACSASPTLYKNCRWHKNKEEQWREVAQKGAFTRCVTVTAENIVQINYWWSRETVKTDTQGDVDTSNWDLIILSQPKPPSISAPDMPCWPLPSVCRHGLVEAG